MKHTRKVLSFFALFGLCSVTGCINTFDPSQERDEVTIGVLLPLSGSLSADGLSQKVAIEMALADVNQAFEDAGKKFRVKAHIKDDQSTPAGALQKLQELFVEDVRIVVGPNSSEQIHRILTFAHDNGMTIVSPSSTSPSLRNSGADNLFRMVSDDKNQTKVLADLITEDGFTQILTLARADLYGSDFESFLSKCFQETYGGTVYNSFSYPTNTTDFGPYMIEMRTDLEAINLEVPLVQTAVQVSSFDEIVAILNAASVQTVLANSTWYGSDGFAMSPSLIQNETASNFAIQTNLKATAWSYAPAYQSNYDAFATRFSQIFTQDAPNLEDALDYDAFTLVARTAESLNGVLTDSAWRAQLPVVASTLVGATGPLTLDSHGDRLENHYAVWKVRSNGSGGFEWYRDSIREVP